MKRWQDLVNAVLGAWLIASPWIFGFAHTHSAAAWCAWVLGAAILIVSLAAARVPAAWQEALTLLLGICSLVSPWVLGYFALSRPVTNALIVGALVVVFSLWEAYADTAVRTWMQAHLHLRSPASR